MPAMSGIMQNKGKTVRRLLQEVSDAFPEQGFRAAVCGSGGKPIAERIGAYYIQEVVANAAAVRALYPNVRTAIELGGQDAKIIFFIMMKRKANWWPPICV